MNYRITGLSLEPFRHLFGLSDEELARHNARRYVADEGSGFPDRVEIRDAEPGESVLLVNYVHQPAETPYRASHAVFIRENAAKTYDRIDQIPPALNSRLIALRAFDADHMIVDADIADGSALEPLIERLLANPKAAYLQAHFAKYGCYAARIERA
jgi:hypothetical protein